MKPVILRNLAAVLLLLSGFSALTYQVVWVRLLGLSIGMTSASVGAVLAAIFLGMALGAWLTSHLPRKFSGRLKLFAAAEALVAISTLALLPLLLHLGELLSYVPELGGQLWFRFLLSTLLLAIPAAGLGAAYPLIAGIDSPDRGGIALWRLYAIHTLGAVAGVLTAAFVLIPQWGLDGALYAAASLNLLAALLALLLGQAQPAPPEPVQTRPEAQAAGSRLGLLVLCVTGMVAVAAQIGWTKYLAIHTGSTLYGFSLLLAMFLGGITLGAWLGGRFAARIAEPVRWVAYGLLTLGLALLLTRAGLGLLPAIDAPLVALQLGHGLEQTARYGAILLVLLPVALLFGALFPLSLRYYCGAHEPARIGKGYAANTLAGVAGAAIAGLWLIPHYGTNQLLWLMALLLTLSSLLLAPWIKQPRARTTLLLAAVAVSGLASVLPGLDYPRLIASADLRQANSLARRYEVAPKFLFVKEGRTGVISLVDYDGIVVLKNDSLNEAHLVLKQASAEILLGLMPQFLKPEAKEVLVVGYGAGTTTKVLAATGTLNIRTIELEPAVVEAMTHHEGGLPAVLRNPAVKLEIDDARNVLQMESRRYDVILSQPSHTWRAGSGALFSREYFQLAHHRLNQGGLFGMWLNLFQMDSTTLRALFKAFFSEFPKGIVLRNSNTSELLLFGSPEPLVLDYDQVAARLRHAEIKPFADALNMATPHRILTNHFLFTSEEALAIAGDSRPVTDLNLLAETRLAWLTQPLDPTEEPMALIRLYVKQ
jgi:spermidine synthase